MVSNIYKNNNKMELNIYKNNNKTELKYFYHIFLYIYKQYKYINNINTIILIYT